MLPPIELIFRPKTLGLYLMGIEDGVEWHGISSFGVRWHLTENDKNRNSKLRHNSLAVCVNDLGRSWSFRDNLLLILGFGNPF